MQTVFGDGPKRDRRLWLGDLQVSACLFPEPEIEGDDTFMFDYSLFFAAELLAQTAERPDAEAMVTPYMMHNYVDALLAVGERDRALEVLRRYWGGMADEGADTFWELYDPADPDQSSYGGAIVNSCCHARSCAPAYFLRKFYK